MAKKTFDVTEYLKEAGINIKLNGKTFTVTDIPFELRELLQDKDADSKKMLQQILGCQEEDVKGLGMATVIKIINTINEALFPPSSLNPPSNG